MSKIGIISDAHLFHRCSQPQLYKRTIQNLQHLGVDFIVDCGDLTDNNILNSVQSAELYDVFSIVSVPMHIVMGNHDSLGGASLASVLNINKNITVHTTVDVVDNLLFIPYINSKKELRKQLDNLGLSESVDFAFSHLMMLDNKYAMLPFSEAPKLLHKYANVVFNGHIHDYSECKTLYGTIYNVGSFSNLTFGEKDTPHYHIYDTDTGLLERYTAFGGIMHRTVTITDEEDIKHLEDLIENENFKFDWRIKLPANFDFNKRNEIREILYDLNNTNSVQFDYLVSQNQKQKLASVSMTKSGSGSKVPLIDKLFESYEQNTGNELSDDIKQQLKDSN